MPELPDVIVYVESLERFYLNKPIKRLDLKSPFLLRTFEPDMFEAEGRCLRRVIRMGKRIAWELDGNLYLVFHLMIAGRFHRRKANSRPANKNDLLAIQFDDETLMLTEASQKKRASLHVVLGDEGLDEHRRDGVEPLECSEEEFRERLMQENRTLKRALTDPRLFSGIGNAYSDEILHAAGMSPVRRSQQMKADEVARLYHATQTTLLKWIDELREEVGDGFPEKVTAFRPNMVVHGKYKEPCTVCGTDVQRIKYADKETNYCPRCQTGGKLLADRSMSRLLKDDWPKTIDELEGA